MRLTKAITVALVAGWVAMPAYASQTYGVVIGIDNYTGVAPKLQGAVNDARDVADALTKSGAADVRLLLDQGANRDAIMAAWGDLLKKAKKDDLMFFHYAGHGGQEPEHTKGSEASGHDSTLLLAGFEVDGAGTYERIIDDEMGAMFKRASDNGVNVLVAIDACHSGTMTRAFKAPSAAKPRVRATTYPAIRITDDKLPPLDPAWARIPDDLPNLIYFGAVQDDEEAPELTIEGQQRGALSWALAAALRGGADADHDGIITKEELQDFIRENIRMKLEGRQHPSVVPQGFRAFQFHLQSAASTERPAAPSGLLAFAIINQASTVPATDLVKALNGVSLVEANSDPVPMLSWDVGRSQVFTGLGDLVAEFSERKPAEETRAFKRGSTAADARPSSDGRADLPKLQGVIDKWRLTERIKRLAETRSLQMMLKPDDKLHSDGAKITFLVDGHDQTYLTLFNLGADGTVNFLYPLNTVEVKDPLQIPLGRAYTVPLVVEAPYGADHLVAVASAQPLPGLHRALREFDGKPQAAALEPLLFKELASQTYRIGIHGSYTAANR